MELKEYFLDNCSDLALLKELEKRIRANKLDIYNSYNADGERFMISIKNENDEDALFLFLSKTSMTSLITNFKNQMDELHGEVREEDEESDENKNEFKILKYWDQENDKRNPEEKIKMTAKLILSEQVKKNLFLVFKEETKSLVFRYYVKGEVRANPDGTEPVYPDDSPADLKNDKFYESKEYGLDDWMGCFMTIIRGDKKYNQLFGRTVAEVVSDIVSQIEKVNAKDN